jgi:NADPH:quinone reductase-like Zn-dependent oxidoreductase
VATISFGPVRAYVGPAAASGYQGHELFREAILARLNGKVALITGAVRGIGEAIARAFIREGADVCLTDIATDSGEALARELGARAIFKRLDVREERDWERVTAEVIASLGRLDVVVNNAGISGFEGGFVAHDPENVSLEYPELPHTRRPGRQSAITPRPLRCGARAKGSPFAATRFIPPRS